MTETWSPRAFTRAGGTPGAHGTPGGPAALRPDPRRNTGSLVAIVAAGPKRQRDQWLAAQQGGCVKVAPALHRGDPVAPTAADRSGGGDGRLAAANPPWNAGRCRGYDMAAAAAADGMTQTG